MQTSEELSRQIKTAQDLHSVVRTMKALAAVKISELQSAVRSLAEYNRTVKMGLRVVLKNRPKKTRAAEPAGVGPLGAVVFGSDQGMCGQFNEEICSHALQQIGHLTTGEASPSVLVVGARATVRLVESGLAVEESFPAAASIGGITPLVQDLLLRIQTWRSERDIQRVVLLHNMQVSSASYRPRTLHMLPLDPAWLTALESDAWPSKVLPTFTMQWDRLFATLVRQYLLVSLYRAGAESQASENAARLVSMQAAEKNIEERLRDLAAEFHHVRQTSITAELLDIVAGFEALTGEEEQATDGQTQIPPP